MSTEAPPPSVLKKRKFTADDPEDPFSQYNQFFVPAYKEVKFTNLNTEIYNEWLDFFETFPSQEDFQTFFDCQLRKYIKCTGARLEPADPYLFHSSLGESVRMLKIISRTCSYCRKGTLEYEKLLEKLDSAFTLFFEAVDAYNMKRNSTDGVSIFGTV